MLVRMPRRIIDMLALKKLVAPPPPPPWERPMVDIGAILGHTITTRGPLNDNKYRYTLWRHWDAAKPALLWVMLNPSTADASFNDPTIKRCMWFADKLGYGGIRVVNLFGYRATKPTELYKTGRVCNTGPDNRNYLIAELALCATETPPLESGMRHGVMCGWGTLNIASIEAEYFFDLARDAGVQLYCLEITKGGFPKHPLYIHGDAMPIEYTPWVAAPDLNYLALHTQL